MLARRHGLLVCLLGALAIAPAPLRADPPQQILGLTLGSSAPVPEQATMVYGIALAPEVIEGPVLVESPAPHYSLKLVRNRELSIWFDASSSARQVYWISLVESYDPSAPPSYADILKSIGHIDYKIPGTQGAPLARLLITLDPTLAEERAIAARRHIEAVLHTRPEGPADDDLFVEAGPGIEYRFKVLGDAFRGRMTAVYRHANKIDGQVTELLDLATARAAQQAR